MQNPSGVLMATNLPLFTLRQLKHVEQGDAVVELPELRKKRSTGTMSATQRPQRFSVCVVERRDSRGQRTGKAAGRSNLSTSRTGIPLSGESRAHAHIRPALP